MEFEPTCLRRTANWTTISKEHKFDKATFDPSKVEQDIAKSSPKLKALLENIKELDEKDKREYGKQFKHFIFSEVKQGGYGVKIITSALIASGYRLAFDNKLRLYSDQDLLTTKNNNFLLLCSTDIFSMPISTRKKKEFLDKYNQRPENNQGELVRFILLDAGYKEGIDLFDVKYVHIFEPQTSKADTKQAIGRATRLCGQKGLDFHPTRGWPLRVFLYDVFVPESLKLKYDGDTMFKMYLKSKGIDLKMMDFVEELERYSIIASIDYELTKNVHRFEIEDDEFYVPLYKLFQQGGGVVCTRKCGKMRPTKNVPVSIPLFMTVMAAQGKYFPALQPNQRVREVFCKELKKNKAFCAGVQEAWTDPSVYVASNKEAIQKGIKMKSYQNLPSYNRTMFLRFVKKLMPALPAQTPEKNQAQSKPIEQTPVQSKAPQTPQQTPVQSKAPQTPQQTPAQSKAPQTPQQTPKLFQQTPAQSKPLQQTPAQSKPLQQTPAQSKPLQQTPAQSKPLQQTPAQSKPLQQTPAQSKPLQQTPTGTPETPVIKQESKGFPTPPKTPPQEQEQEQEQEQKQEPKEELIQVVKNPEVIKQLDKVEDKYESPSKIMTFLEIRNFMRDHYLEYTWPKVKLENLCVPKGGSDIVKFTPTQDLIRHYFTPQSAYKGMLLWHSVGTGKCHGKDTPILMYDGSIKMVQDVEVGDVIMGDDSTPRTVLALGRGQDNMYRIKQPFGDSYTTNSEHIMCLKDVTDQIHEIEVKDFINLPTERQLSLHGYKHSVDFTPASKVFDAYDIGFEKHAKLPRECIINIKQVRHDVLAGVIDATGELVGDKFVLKSTNKDIVFLARSLGFNSYVLNNRIIVQGHGIDIIPTRNPVLKAFYSDLNVTKYNIEVESLGKGDYYGFTLDGNNRYLLGDFTVTHNTCCAIATATSTFEKEGYTILWVTRTTLKSDIWKNMFDQVCSMVMQEKMLAGQKIPEDFSKRMRMLSKSWKIKPLSYKQFSNLVSGKNQLYKDLVAINGAQDPLKKTLLIIDEAHKLYGGADLSSVERPNMPKLHSAIMNSYKLSGKDSVKVLMMTATPITNDPMELLKLINLIREEQLPTKYEEFAEKYLDETGKFTKKGSRQYLDDIAGSISYLSREKDARQFSQPSIVPVLVPLGTGDYGSDTIEKLQEELDAHIEKNNQDQAYYKDKISEVKQLRTNMKKDLKAKCQNLKGQEKSSCLKEIEFEIGYRDKQFEADLDNYSQKLSNIATQNKDLKAEFAHKKKLAKEDVSQQAILETKCLKSSKKKKN